LPQACQAESGDLAAPDCLPPGTFDLVLANPPYIPDHEWETVPANVGLITLKSVQSSHSDARGDLEAVLLMRETTMKRIVLSNLKNLKVLLVPWCLLLANSVFAADISGSVVFNTRVAGVVDANAVARQCDGGVRSRDGLFAFARSVYSCPSRELVRNVFAIFASFCWILRISERVLTEDSERNEDSLH
jgi:hypothetical protein